MSEKRAQINIRLESEEAKQAFKETLAEKQKHIPHPTALFEAVIAEVMRISERGELIEWPPELVTKKKR